MRSRTLIDSTDMLQETLTFFRVASVDAWNKGWSHHQIAFRKSGSKTDCTGKIAAWVRLAEVKAESIECAAFDVKKFKSAISELRLLVDSEPRIFVPAMQEQCAAAGVALALVQELPGGHVSGAAKWLSSTKAMIALNLRGKALDKFWFTFFHEAGHILNDSRDQVFVDVDYADDPRELKANKFAREVLIPPEHEAALSGLRTEAAVRTFARNIKVHPSIVVGRLQREKIVPYNRMKRLDGSSRLGSRMSRCSFEDPFRRMKSNDEPLRILASIVSRSTGRSGRRRAAQGCVA